MNQERQDNVDYSQFFTSPSQCTVADLVKIECPAPTKARPVVELYMVDAKDPRLFVTNVGERSTDRRKSLEYLLDAPETLIPPAGMTWRYIRLKKPTPFY